jgi:hypothetical protein
MGFEEQSGLQPIEKPQDYTNNKEKSVESLHKPEDVVIDAAGEDADKDKKEDGGGFGNYIVFPPPLVRSTFD